VSVIWSRFLSCMEQGRLPHAMLLVGSNVAILRTMSQKIAAYLLCQNKGESAPCGHCRACELFIAQTHPDIKIIVPEGKLEVIKVDEVRACIEFVGMHANQSGAKLVCIERADRMNIAAANAVLKSLEEPPLNTYFILMAQNTAQLMPTIRSRCQVWHLEESAHEALNEETQLMQSQLITAMARQQPPVTLAQTFQEVPYLELLGWLQRLIEDCIKCHNQLHHVCYFQSELANIKRIAEQASLEDWYARWDKLVLRYQDANLPVQLNAKSLYNALFIACAH